MRARTGSVKVVDGHPPRAAAAAVDGRDHHLHAGDGDPAGHCMQARSHVVRTVRHGQSPGRATHDDGRARSRRTPAPTLSQLRAQNGDGAPGVGADSFWNAASMAAFDAVIASPYVGCGGADCDGLLGSAKVPTIIPLAIEKLTVTLR